MTSAETNLTTEAEQRQAESPEINPCQGYKVDSITRLHLCQTCSYHKYRNQTKPWLK